MKKVLAIAVLAALVLGAFGVASAAELSVTGEFKANAQWDDNLNVQNTEQDDFSEDDFAIRERARIIFRFSANDNLSGVLRIQYGPYFWGDATPGNNFGQIGTTSSSAIGLKRAYLEFRWPDTEILFQAGKLSLSLPNNFGSAIIGTDTSAFLVSSPITDMVSFTAGFARAIDLNPKGEPSGSSSNDEWDHIILAVPLSFDGLKIAPFFDFSILGNGVTPNIVFGTQTPASIANPALRYEDSNVTPWWAGLTFDLTMFDPIVVNGDFNYGSLSDGDDALDRKGWLADLSVSYTGLDLFVPTIFGLYTTGEDDNVSNGSERMPVIADDFAWGTFFYGGSDLLGGDLDNPTVGTWAVGAGLEDISFIEKLSHNFYFLWINGTNDTESAPYLTKGAELTTDDRVFEFDLNTKYMIYEQLAAILELSYLVNDLDEDIWGSSDDSWKIGFGFNYSF